MIEDDEMIEEPFGSLSECTDYYIDILSDLKEAHDKEILTKKEFKNKKKFVMSQYDLNLKVVKKKDSHNRKKDIKNLRQPLKSLNHKIDSKIQISNNSSEKIYQIEDKHGQPIKGQMDIEELNGGDVYEEKS